MHGQANPAWLSEYSHGRRSARSGLACSPLKPSDNLPEVRFAIVGGEILRRAITGFSQRHHALLCISRREGNSARYGKRVPPFFVSREMISRRHQWECASSGSASWGVHFGNGSRSFFQPSGSMAISRSFNRHLRSPSSIWSFGRSCPIKTICCLRSP